MNATVVVPHEPGHSINPADTRFVANGAEEMLPHQFAVFGVAKVQEILAHHGQGLGGHRGPQSTVGGSAWRSIGMHHLESPRVKLGSEQVGGIGSDSSVGYNARS